MTIDFSKEIKDQVDNEIQALLAYFADATDKITSESLQHEVPWKQSTGNIQNIFNRHIDLIWAIYTTKFSLLMQSIILAVNREDFLTYGLVGRSIVEHAAVLRHYCKNEIILGVQELSKEGSITSQQEIKELLIVMETHLRGSCFYWDSFFKGDVSRLYDKKHNEIEQQVRVGQCIKEWSKENPSLNIAYKLFCDFVHPNLGSNYLIMRDWDGEAGFGGSRGSPFGLELLKRTFAGLVVVIREATNLLDSLPLQRFPEQMI